MEIDLNNSISPQILPARRYGGEEVKSGWRSPDMGVRVEEQIRPAAGNTNEHE